MKASNNTWKFQTNLILLAIRISKILPTSDWGNCVLGIMVVIGEFQATNDDLRMVRLEGYARKGHDIRWILGPLLSHKIGNMVVSRSPILVQKDPLVGFGKR